jgi:2-amino-4-ketopentanoate thiolase alpha subunit
MNGSDGSRATPGSPVSAGAWVEITQILLRAGGRAPNIPSDTAQTDFVARIRGFLVAPSRIGDEATVRTLLERSVTGRLSAENPRNSADFGDPVPELLRLGMEARRTLESPSR